jgi:hypothetical protein
MLRRSAVGHAASSVVSLQFSKEGVMAKFGLARCALTLLLGLALTGASTRAQQKPRVIDMGNDLYSDLDDCLAMKNGRGSAAQEDNCVMVFGYVHGVYDVLRVLGKVSDSGSRTQQQIVDTVHLYLVAHPEQRDMHAVVLVIAALTKAYPPQ